MSSEPESCGDDLGIEGEEIVCETSVKSEDEEDEDTQSETFSVEGHRPVRPVERQKMRPWLIDLLDKNILPGLSWQNKKENIFRISWKHAAHNCFNRNRDSDLFERWAIHTGRHHEGNHKRWKANFRCALNSLPDVMELKELGVRKGDNAFKVYKFLDSPEPSLKEKMEIKKKYSLMAGIKLEDLSQSESSTPTASTAPSSPDAESSVGVDGGIQTLLKAIELKTLHAQQGAVKDSSKTPQKRASSGGTTQTRSKRKKESKDEETLVLVQTESSSGRPSPASTPGSSDRSTISAISPEEAKQLKYPFVGSLDPKTKRVTLVQLKKTDTSLPSTPTRGTPTGEIPVSKMLVNFPGITVSDSQNVLSSLRLGEQYITLPAASESPIQEQKITIPIQLLQQELLQKQPLSPGMVSIQSLLAGNSAASVQIAKQLESLMNPTIPIPVMEKINQAKNKDKQQKEMNPAEKQMPKIILQTDQQHVRMVATAPVTENLPTPQLNRNITSIAAALRMSTPVSLPVSSTVVTSTFIQPSQSVTTSIPAAGLAQDPQGIRSKLVSRLMVSGSSMTSTTPNVRMPTGIQMATIIAPPRPRLDHLLVKPNPSLTLPRTQLQPVKPNDIVVMATATSSNIDLMSSSGPPLLMPGHERTIDLNANKNISSSVSTTQTKRTKEADVISLVSIGSGYSSPVCTPELRPDILDRQVTIELGKIEKDIMTSKSAEDTQHYLCLWCQINFAKKSDLLHHFLQLHQDMLVVPGETEGEGHPDSSYQAAPEVSSASQEMVADVSSTTPITVCDVSSTSSDIVIPPLQMIQDDDDDEPPVIIDVMINTSQNRGERPQIFYQDQGVKQKGVNPPPLEDLSNASTISAAESADSMSKPKYSLNDLIKALSQSLEQDQATSAPLPSVMMSPALQYFNLAQATALQADPGLSGIPSTVMTGIMTPRGRGRGRGRGSTSSRGRGRRKKDEDVSPEMPQLLPEVPKTGICYDNLPESSESGEDEGPPKITRIVKKRQTKSKTTSPSNSETGKMIATTSSFSPLPSDEAFIPGIQTPQSSETTKEENDEDKEEEESSDQAIHVTVKMYEVNGKTMYKCTECGKDFSKTCTFARHAMLHSKMYPYQCGICDMKCGDMRILLRHLDQHAEDADCPCQKCDRMNKEFSEETQRKVSAAFHFKCNICGKKFFSDYACKIHVNAHKRKMTLTCEQCKLEFRCNRILSRHRKAVHDTQFCPVCLETCTNLIIHMRTHVGFTLYRCGLCGDGFNSRPQLHDHLRIHTQLGAQQPSTVTTNSSSSSVLFTSPSIQSEVEEISKEDKEAKIATETLIALGNSLELGSVIATQDVKTEPVAVDAQSPASDFIVRTGEYEDEDGEIDVHVIPKTRRQRFKSKSSEISDDKDISVELAPAQLPRKQVSRRCRWHGNDSLCERCDDTFVKTMSSNRKRRSAERGSSTRGRRGSKSPRSDYSDSLKLNSDSLDSLKNIEFSLPLANYILKGDDSKQDLLLKEQGAKTGVQGEPTVIELSD